jgi:glycosyltransferase involved in cell wall biosynthesis
MPVMNSSERAHRACVILLAYNQQETIETAMASVLGQQCEPIEIVLSDDASTDGTFAMMQAAAERYHGPHRVHARRNVTNAGIGGHYNELVQATQAPLLVTAAGDDISAPDRVARLLQAWDAGGGRADLIASHLIDLDHEGRLHGVIRVDDLASYGGVDDWARRRPYIVGAGHAFTRRMMARFGPMATDIAYEDQVMVFRAIVSGGAITVDAPLVQYRRGGTSRRPRFESAADLARWTVRQRGREIAEMAQLFRDAEVAGCRAQVEAALHKPFARATYMQRLALAESPAEIRQVYREAGSLPWLWRFKKMLHARFPKATYKVKSGLAVFQRRRH